MVHEAGPPMGMMEDVGDAQAEADRWNSKGNAYLAVKDYVTAISCFDLALKTLPGADQEDIYLSNRATALFRIGEYEPAVAGFQRAAELKPLKHSHLTCLGKVYLRWSGHETEALEALTRSLEIEPTMVASHLQTKAHLAVEKRQQHATPMGIENQLEDGGSSAIGTSLSDGVQNGPHLLEHDGPGSNAEGDTNEDDRMSTVSNSTSVTANGTMRTTTCSPSSTTTTEKARGRSNARSSRDASFAGSRGSPPTRRGTMSGPTTWDLVRSSQERAWTSGPISLASVPKIATKSRVKKLVRSSSNQSSLDTGAPAGAVARVVAQVSAAGKAASGKGVEATVLGGRWEDFASSGVDTSTGSSEDGSVPRAEATKPTRLPDLCNDKTAAGGDDEPPQPSTPEWGLESFMSRWTVFGGSTGTPRGGRARMTSPKHPPEREKERSAPLDPRRSAYFPPPNGNGSPFCAPKGSRSPPTGAASCERKRVVTPKTKAPAKMTDCLPQTSSSTGSNFTVVQAIPTRGCLPSATQPAVAAAPEAQDYDGKRTHSTGSAGGSPLGSSGGSDEGFEGALQTVAVVTRRLNHTCPSPGRYSGTHQPVESLTVPQQSRVSTAVSADSSASSQRHKPGESVHAGPSAEASKVALAAMAAGAAPVKWGKARVEERARRASVKAGRTCEGPKRDVVQEIPPSDLGPLRKDWRSRSSERAGLSVATAWTNGGRINPAPGSTGGAQSHRGGPHGGGTDSTRRPGLEVDGDSGSSATPTVPAAFMSSHRNDAESALLQSHQIADSSCLSPSRMNTADRSVGGTEKHHGRGGQTHLGTPRFASASVSRADVGNARTAFNEAASQRIGGESRNRDRDCKGDGEEVRWGDGGVWRGTGQAQQPQQLKVFAEKASTEDGAHGVRWEGVGNRSPASFANRKQRRPVFSEQDDVSVMSTTSMPSAQSGTGHRGTYNRAPSGLSLFWACRGGDVGAAVVASEVTGDQARPGERTKMTISVDSDQWSGTRLKGRAWRLRWPGRHRGVSIATCLESPQTARSTTGSMFSRARRTPTYSRRSGTGGGKGSAESCDGDASTFSVQESCFSEYSTSSLPPDLAKTGKNRLSTSRKVVTSSTSRPVSTSEVITQRGNTRTQRGNTRKHRKSHNNGSGSSGAGSERLRRWVNGRLGGGHGEEGEWGGVGSKKSPGLPTEEEVRRWMGAVLGPRASAGEGQNGEVALAGLLKDGRVLVRLVNAIGGAKTARVAQEVEATTPMLVLLNVHTFMAAARAIGVPETSLFHPKDLVDAPSNGPCARSVLRCLAALSEAVRKHAYTETPCTFYNGPLLGDDLHTIPEDTRSSKRGFHSGAGSSGGEGSIPTSPNSSFEEGANGPSA